MKKIILTLIAISSFTALESCNSKKVVVNREVETAKYGKMLLGVQTRDQLYKEPYKTWYDENYNDYPTDTLTIKALKKAGIRSYKISVFLGTWCGDSQTQVPQLMKILDDVKFPAKKLTLIGVNRKMESPSGRASLHIIRKVPTIILTKYGKEVGRITETPETGYIEKDLLQIIQKK
ncbi:MAG: thioredoxin [Flavobacteriales bacterium]|nr:MAG: thioredoxin [Flavobacteriales bacterium]